MLLTPLMTPRHTFGPLSLAASAGVAIVLLACGRTPLDSVPVSASASPPGSPAGDPHATDASSPAVDGARPGATDSGPGDCPRAAGDAADCASGGSKASLPSTAPCLAGGNVLWVSGERDAWVYEGTTTVSGGTWDVISWLSGNPEQGALFEITPPGATPDEPPWFVVLSLWPLRTQSQVKLGTVYEHTVTSINGATDGSPLLDVQSFASCEVGEGAFRFDDLRGGDKINSMRAVTAAFWLRCNGHRGALHGCIHYEN